MNRFYGTIVFSTLAALVLAACPSAVRGDDSIDASQVATMVSAGTTSATHEAPSPVPRRLAPRPARRAMEWETASVVAKGIGWWAWTPCSSLRPITTAP